MRRRDGEAGRARLNAAAFLAAAGCPAPPFPLPRDDPGGSTLTMSGVPFEASVTSHGDDDVRYVAEVGSGLSTFQDRLAAQRRALPDLVAAVGAAGAADTAERLVDAGFPGAIPAGTRFATWFGVSVGAGSLSAVKIYANLRAGQGAWAQLRSEPSRGTERQRGARPDPALPGALARLADVSPALARLAAVSPALARLGATYPWAELSPAFAAVEFRRGASGPAWRLYASPRPGAEHQGLERLAEACGLDPGVMFGELHRRCLARLVWGRGVLTCLRLAPGGEPRLAVHLPAARAQRAPAPAGGASGALARAERLLDDLGGPGAGRLDRLLQAATATGMSLAVSVIGVSFDPAGSIERASIYLAPMPFA